MQAAKQISKEVFQSSWRTDTSVKKDALISYLLVEQVNPPEHVWDKIVKELEKPLNSNKMNNHFSILSLSKPATVIALVVGAIISVTAILYFLI